MEKLIHYAGIKENDVYDGEGICVSFWVQGCPFHCPHCHNPETWDFDGGIELPSDWKSTIIKAISKNNVRRNFSVLGGEPLCEENIKLTADVIRVVRTAYPQIHIYLWTGFTLEELKEKDDPNISFVLTNIDTLIDGKFIYEEKDLTLKLRGSKNQRILEKGIDF